MTARPDSPDAARRAEDAKTDAQRAEDIAYTLNHALACTATDFIDPYFGHLTQQFLGRRFSIGCGHDHSQDGHDHHHHHDHDHNHHDHEHTHAAKQGTLKQWMIGEFAGDFGAVPVTIAFQRMAPGFMHQLQNMMEPVLSSFFYKGAQRTAKKEAREQGVALDSPEFKARVDEIYKHEVDHLPQALIWTASSISINLGVQRLIGNKAPLWQMATSKAVGAAISAGLVVGGRGAAPGAARAWDQFTSKHIFLPATKVLGGLIGIDSATVEHMAQKEEAAQNATWAQRVDAQEVQPQKGEVAAR